MFAISATVGEANRSCTVKFTRKLLFTFRSKCVANNECLKSDEQKQIKSQ